MTGHRGFPSRAEYEAHYRGPLPKWEMAAMEEYSREAEEERKQLEMINPPEFKEVRYLGDTAAKAGVEINVRHDGLMIWINIDGICAARIATNGFIPIEFKDDRIKK